VRIASYNVENMFRRPVALNQATWAKGRPILEAYSELQALLEQASYSAADKTQIVELLTSLGLLKSDESRWAILRRTRGQLVTRSRDGTVRVTADGRGDWIGWLELKREAVNEDATRNTARVVGDMAADVLAVIEAEDRPALQRFNEDVLPFGFAQGTPAWRHRHVMLIDGNDDRGIDVGLLTRDRFPIARMRSHVDDLAPNGERLFSRDCPEYELALPGGKSLLVLVNHFKSKGHGTQASSNARRRAQATRVAEIYESRRGDGWKRVAVVGDLNDTPASAPLDPLLNGTDLKDVSQHPAYIQDGRTGTFKTSKDKFDYLLLSPELFGAITQAGLNRSGVWHGPKVKNPWPMLNTLTREVQAASDHAAIWADIAL
jgi:endonuclease/exonuclease/phosphatase family metal-dependent hydrolase